MKTMTVVLEIETDESATWVRRHFQDACHLVPYIKQVSVQVADQTKGKPARKPKPRSKSR